MLLTITTTHKPATDLGYLLHKNPDSFQSINLSIGKAHIFYPEKSVERATLCLLLDIDPIDMVRGAKRLSGKGFALQQYVNDRPYVVSSFISVALSKAFSTAMNGRCKHKPELVDKPLPLTVTISALPAPKGGELLIRSIFEPLGYNLELERQTLDEKFPEWGHSKYFSLTLSHTITVRELLSHLYVLIPALDNDKHYFVSQAEIDKLLAKGEGWLNKHPAKEQITKRYLINLQSLSRQALERLADDEISEEGSEEITEVTAESVKKETLNTMRLKRVTEQLQRHNVDSVIDLGCGEGKLLRLLLKHRQFKKISGMDVAHEELIKARKRLRWEEMAPKQKERISLFQGSLIYKDKRLKGYDAATLVEVIEHLNEDRLDFLERAVFEFTRPELVIVTTPNKEYNALYEGMEENSMRHSDHRFEWTRKEFEEWAGRVAQKNNYRVEFLPVGELDEKLGSPTQMGVFSYGN